MTIETKQSGTEAWVHSEILLGRRYATEDFPGKERQLLGTLAKESYIKELARLLNVKIEVKE